jgi:hypothetical protein
MNYKQGARRFAGMLAGACLATASLPVVAGLEQECRQEAEDYGIAPEQLDDYISGCVLSRGGSVATEAPDEYYSPPVEDTGEDAQSGEADENGGDGEETGHAPS